MGACTDIGPMVRYPTHALISCLCQEYDHECLGDDAVLSILWHSWQEIEVQVHKNIQDNSTREVLVQRKKQKLCKNAME